MQFEDCTFDAATASTIEEAKELLAVGLNYLTDKKKASEFSENQKGLMANL